MLTNTFRDFSGDDQSRGEDYDGTHKSLNYLQNLHTRTKRYYFIDFSSSLYLAPFPTLPSFTESFFCDSELFHSAGGRRRKNEKQNSENRKFRHCDATTSRVGGRENVRGNVENIFPKKGKTSDYITFSSREFLSVLFKWAVLSQHELTVLCANFSYIVIIKKLRE